MVLTTGKLYPELTETIMASVVNTTITFEVLGLIFTKLVWDRVGELDVEQNQSQTTGQKALVE